MTTTDVINAEVCDFVKNYKNQKLYFVTVVETRRIPIQAQSEKNAIEYMQSTNEWKGSEDYYTTEKSFKFEIDKEITEINEISSLGYDDDCFCFGVGIDGTENTLITVQDMFGKRDEYDFDNEDE
jgi:hypothetical protein